MIIRKIKPWKEKKKEKELIRLEYKNDIKKKTEDLTAQGSSLELLQEEEVIDPKCSLCFKAGRCSKRTMFHILNCCPEILDRFKLGHDSISQYITKALQKQSHDNTSVYSDILGFDINGGTIPSHFVITTHRPDLVWSNKILARYICLNQRVPLKIILKTLLKKNQKIHSACHRYQRKHVPIPSWPSWNWFKRFYWPQK